MKSKLRKNSRQALQDVKLQRNLKKILPQVLLSHDQSVASVENWQELRDYAHRVKSHTMGHLDHYLVELEQKVVAQGGVVFWAESAKDATDYILELAHKREITKVVKSKSMLGEEIGLNEALEQAHIDPVETDLGEYIIQLLGQKPSHIVAPALHLSQEDIAELFVNKLGMKPTQDIKLITLTAREKLRSHFLSARMGITGVNFGVAETGSIVVVENEGNARLSLSVPQIHVAIMGIEKIVPRQSDLAVFLRLLTRSASGQPISSYVNFIHGPKRDSEIDGPTEFHLVLVDNGRSQLLQDELFRQTLFCIRCGACLTVCPVYQHVGGHCYGSTYPGPIGAILTPQLEGLKEAPGHPFMSSLCGACGETCPVKIEIPHILLSLRDRVQRQLNQKASHLSPEKLGMWLWSQIMSNPSLYRGLSRWKGRFIRLLGNKAAVHLPPLSRWMADRDLPNLPERSFRELVKEEKQ
jgi:L-lactate dehydrogenase complex protein LldF